MKSEKVEKFFKKYARELDREDLYVNERDGLLLLFEGFVALNEEIDKLRTDNAELRCRVEELEKPGGL